MSIALENQRTYALVGTGGSGKTSLAEMLLFQAGIINRLGAIEEGTTALDYEPEEIKRRGSIQPGFATFDWKGFRHNLVDIPGDSNFSADMEWLQAMIDAGYQFSPGNEIGKNNIWYGDYIYADSNGDMIYGNAYDNKFINRSTTPRVNYGLQISMEYKGFDLYMNWAGAAGFMLYWGPSGGYNTSSMTHGFGLSSDIAYNHYFYDPENPSDIRTKINGKYERLTVGTAGTQNNVASTRFLHKGDFLKLKNLVIGYTVPVRRIANVRIPKIRVYLSGDNLLLFTKFPGQDPELGAYPTYSSVRSFSLGLNVTF